MKQMFTVLAFLIIAQMSTVQSVFSQADTSQAFTFPVLNKYGKTPDDFAPKDWEITDTESGDLNKDGVDDVAVILAHHDSVKMDKGYRYPRILLVVFKVGDRYELKLQHNTLVERQTLIDGDYIEDDAPFDSMEITNGVLRIHFKWNEPREPSILLQYVVRYQSNDFYLIGATFIRGYRSDTTTSDFNFSTRRYTDDEEDYESGFGGEDSFYHKKGKLPLNSLKKLSEIKKPRTWNVADIADI